MERHRYLVVQIRVYLKALAQLNCCRRVLSPRPLHIAGFRGGLLVVEQARAQLDIEKLLGRLIVVLVGELSIFLAIDCFQLEKDSVCLLATMNAVLD